MKCRKLVAWIGALALFAAGMSRAQPSSAGSPPTRSPAPVAAAPVALAQVALVQVGLAQVGLAQVAESPEQAGDALAASTTVDAAKTALLTILTGAGIAVDDGTGAPASSARATIPAEWLSMLAADHVSGASISLAKNAAMFDQIIRGGGGPAVDAASFSTVLQQWVAAPADPQEGYLLDAVTELGRRTVPSYDLTKGAPPTSSLPLLLLVEEVIAVTNSLHSRAGQSSGLRTPAPAFAEAAASPAGDLCHAAVQVNEKLEQAKTVQEDFLKLEGWYFQQIQGGSTFGQDVASAMDNFSQTLDNVEGVGENTGEASFAALLTLLNAMLQFALTQGNLQVDPSQEPKPVDKHESDADPNKVAVKLTVKASAEMPYDLAECLKDISLGKLGGDLPKPGDAIAHARVNLSAGTGFWDNAKFDDDWYIRAGDPSRIRQYTDKDGTLTVHLETQPQKVPKSVKKQQLRDAVLHVELVVQDPGLSPQAMLTYLADKLVPWSNDYPVVVRQRVSNAITLKGQFDSNLLIAQIAGSLNLHSCDGFNGLLNGTFAISGQEVVVGGGSKSYHIGIAVPFDQPQNAPDAAATPKIGPVTTLTGRFGIEFVDDHTAELTVDGDVAADQSGAPMLFTVSQGAAECPDS